MKKSSIKEEILRAAYSAWEKSTNCFLNQLRESHGWDEEALGIVVNDLEDKGFIKHHGQWDYRLTTQGVIFAEVQHIISSEISRPHKQARKETLKTLARLRQAEGENKTIYFEELLQTTGIDRHLFLKNERVLRDLGYIEILSVGHYRITSAGLRLI